MSKIDNGSNACCMATYECCHTWCPGTVDCRPIYVADTVSASGMRVVRADQLPMYGLAVEIVSAVRQPASAAGNESAMTM